MHTIVTSFGPEGYVKYGRKFIDSYRASGASPNLICAWEGPCPDPGLNGFDLLDTEPAKSFYERHKTNPIIRGIHDAPPARWAPKAKRIGYSFRHDAWKFSHKVFAIGTAAQYVSGGKLFWIDADVVFREWATADKIKTTSLSSDFLERLLPDTVSLCYLKRANYHTEGGFVGYNLNRKECRQFVDLYVAQYATDAFLNDQHWDDCNQFDYLVGKLKPSTRPIQHTSQAHPFNCSALGQFMRHNKGNQKWV